MAIFLQFDADFVKLVAPMISDKKLRLRCFKDVYQIYFSPSPVEIWLHEWELPKKPLLDHDHVGFRNFSPSRFMPDGVLNYSAQTKFNK